MLTRALLRASQAYLIPISDTWIGVVNRFLSCSYVNPPNPPRPTKPQKLQNENPLAMGTRISPTRTQPCCSSSPLSKTKPRESFVVTWTSLSIKLREKPNRGPCLAQRLNLGVAARCANWRSAGSVEELGRDLAAEMKPEGKDDWIVETGKLRERCKERKGIVELLECLETEAIMGDDEGIDPTDYNRRAQIFYRSYQVFTALKERATPSHDQSRERCKEREGMVELLECLETEAIMGDDEGRDPTDYNRRAQIFDKSYQVFTALKEPDAPSPDQSPSHDPS